MNVNDELLEYIYQISEIGVKSTTYLLKNLQNKENKIKRIVEDQLTCYESFLKETKKILKKNEIEPKSKGKMTDMMLWMSMKMSMAKDNCDAKIADMLIQGFTMGTIEITKKISDYDKKAFSSVIKLAHKLKKFQEKNIELLKSYL